ncbi:MAG: hypothetical protein HS115_18360 [Spirochaetales bacterium]|nr:hypothetical protein [Spirochaetales bacterium]
MPLIAHLLHWTSLLGTVLIYLPETRFSGLLFLSGALAVFIVAHQARSKGILWLHRTDTLIAQSFVICGFILLSRWELDWVLIAGLILVQTLTFTILTQRLGDRLLEEIGRLLYLMSGGWYAALVLNESRTGENFYQAGATIVLVTLLTFSQRRLLPREDTLPGWKISGSILEGLLLLLIYGSLKGSPYASAIASAIAFALFFLPAHKTIPADRSWYFRCGIWVFLLFAHLWFWKVQFTRSNIPDLIYAILAWLPFIAVSATVAIKLISPFPLLRNAAVCLVALQLGLWCVRLTRPEFPLLLGLSWLLLSLLAAELARALQKRVRDAAAIETLQHIYYTGTVLVVAFLVRHLLVELQSELPLGGISARLAIQLFGLAAIIYWFSIPGAGAPFSSRVQPFFLEFAMILSWIILEREIPERWMSTVYALLPFPLLLLSRWRTMDRLKVYALCFFWGSAFYLAFLSSTGEMPAIHLADQNWIAGLVTLCLLLAAIFPLRQIRFAKVDMGPFQGIMNFREKIDRRVHLWILDPLFLAAAFFLYWSFDQALLTLLWVALLTIVFSMSIFLRENHFRQISLIALALCLTLVEVY